MNKSKRKPKVEKPVVPVVVAPEPVKPPPYEVRAVAVVDGTNRFLPSRTSYALLVDGVEEGVYSSRGTAEDALRRYVARKAEIQAFNKGRS